MKIYTRTGDQGTTSLVGGSRTSKSDPRIEAYGTVDELMAHIGYLHDILPDTCRTWGDDLLQVLDRLMSCAALLATAEEGVAKKMPQIEQADIEWLEKRTDAMLRGLDELRHFTLPCGNPALSYSHVCRTVCRRAERETVRAADRYTISASVMGYINRLSDYLYALGRRLGADLGAEDIRWIASTSESR